MTLPPEIRIWFLCYMISYVDMSPCSYILTFMCLFLVSLICRKYVVIYLFLYTFVLMSLCLCPHDPMLLYPWIEIIWQIYRQMDRNLYYIDRLIVPKLIFWTNMGLDLFVDLSNKNVKIEFYPNQRPKLSRFSTRLVDRRWFLSRSRRR